MLIPPNDTKLSPRCFQVTALYAEYCEGQGRSKAWDVDEITNRLEKLISKSEHFLDSDGCVQLSESGIAKYSPSGVVSD